METPPRLTRELIFRLSDATQRGVEVPSSAMLDLPVRVVQFGTGAFLRGFAEYFIDSANRRGTFNGSVVAVSSTGSTRDTTLNEQDGLYTLVIQGLEDGVSSRRYQVVCALRRALSARDEWDAVLTIARDPSIELVISNTTEVGIALDAADAFDANPPRSFPAKLTRFLAERARAFDCDPKRGLIVLPCELIERNGDTLRRLVGELVAQWTLGADVERWINENVVFCNTLVDRIVPGGVSGAEAKRVESELGFHDALLTSCEPYALFAIEGDERLRERIGFADADARVVVTADIEPYRARKVRLLNGGHTIAVPAALLAGLETVRDACEDERIGVFLRRAMLDEIAPSLRAPGAVEFAREVLARFANSYIRHSLIDITLHGTAKMRVRVVPSIVEYFERTGRTPSALALGFAAYLAFMRGELHDERRAAGLTVPEDAGGARVRAVWERADVASDAGLMALVREVCADTTLWGTDLSRVGEFADAVGNHLSRIVRQGIVAALDDYLAEPAVI